jgi:DNA-binding transcriptional MerR regulator
MKLRNPETITMTTAVERTGLSSQYIINLVVRYHLLSPLDTNWGTRDVYLFTEEDITFMLQVRRLKDAGFMVRDMIEVLELFDQLSSQEIDVSKLTIHEFMSFLLEVNLLNDQEKSVLRGILAQENLVSIAYKNGFRDENTVKKFIIKLHEKVGRLMIMSQYLYTKE